MNLSAFDSLDPLWRVGLMALALLVVASLIVAVIQRARPQRDFSELSARVQSWWWMAAVFFGAIVLSDRVALVLFAFFSYWALKEFLTLLNTRPADHRGLIYTFAAIPVQYYWIATGWYGMFVIFIPVYMFLLLPVRLVLAKEVIGFVASASQIQWGLMAFVFGLSHLGAMLNLQLNAPPGVSGRTLVIFLVFVVELSDVLQYVWGKSFGRHRIIPTVSPNKTWEGLIGGILSVAVLSLGLRFLTPFSALETLGVSLLITVAGFCGGAVMSAVKRDFGVKDFGSIIPGHGGMLDRVDSLCYAAPIFFHYVRYCYVP